MDGAGKMSPNAPAQEYFSSDYFVAREKFRKTARIRDFRVVSYVNPHALGPNGEPLTTDVAIHDPGGAKNALLIISGTHGVEGYAGSACQIGFLTERRFERALGEFKIVLIHALNPYGFAWNRRVTEDNVDLNRNFVNHSEPRQRLAGYEELKDAIAPSDLSSQALELADLALRGYGKKHGPFALQEAISQGQYHHPKGLYYGGTFETWSAGLLNHLMRRELSACRRIGVVDIHTGLGPYGVGELITEEPHESPAYRRARAWWGDSVRSTKSGESVSTDVTGSIDAAIPVLLRHAEVTICCLEYGTYPVLDVFHALRADNWLHAYASPSDPKAKEIKAQIRRAFYPDQPDWKEMVWEKAGAVFAQALEGLKTP
jgi:hypothetical protein